MAVLVVILLISCSLFAVYGPSFTRFASQGDQVYEGDVNRTALFLLLRNESFDPRIDIGSGSGRMRFQPFCGVNGTPEATRSKSLMNRLSQVTFFENYTNVTVRTKDFDQRDKSEKVLNSEVKCSAAKIKVLFESKLGLRLVQEKVYYHQTLPGFELIVAVTTVIAAAYIFQRRKMRGQKE